MSKSIFITIAIIILNSFPALADENTGSDNNQDIDSTKFDLESLWEIDQRFDWVIDVRVRDSNYLSYAGSKLKPLTKLSISYRLNPRYGENAGKPIKYEELWYHNGRTIGCRRCNNLDIPSPCRGAIRITPCSEATHNVSAISGGIARLTLDVALQHLVLDAIFIPTAVFQPVLDDLARFNFLPTAVDVVNTQPILVRFFTDPLASSRILYLCTDKN